MPTLPDVPKLPNLRKIARERRIQRIGRVLYQRVLLRSGRQVAKRLHLDSRNVLLFLLSVVLAGLTIPLLEPTGLPREAILMASIFVIASLLWVTEALPLFATAIVIIGLQVVLLANPGGWAALGFEAGPTPDYRTFLEPLADPIIVLFFGGFVLAKGATKQNIDLALAGIILRVFRGRPELVMLGLMLVTAVFSMWMSNTATTAMMITLVVPMLEQVPKGDPLRKGLLLSVPLAANIGGMGTPIASPPNAVAVGFLQSAGHDVSFLDWMLMAVPLMMALLAVTWVLLRRLFPPKNDDLHLVPEEQEITGWGWFVVVVFVVTIGLWLSEAWHGLPTAVVAMVPAIAFTATSMLKQHDINGLEWNILILIAGGIALGRGMQLTGLDVALVESLPMTAVLVLPVLIVATLLLSTFMSNTAAANLLLPIGVSFAVALPGPGAVVVGVCIALAASVSMALPVSTPPNAIAYAQGDLETRDFIRIGAMVGVIAVTLIVLFGNPIVSFWMT